MVHDGNQPSGKGSNIGSPSRTRKFHFRLGMGADIGTVDVSESIDFRSANETCIHPASLQKSHHLDQSAAPGRFFLIRRIGHGIEHLLCRLVPDDSAFEKPNGVWCMGQFGNTKSSYRQPHSDKYHFMIPDFPCSRDDHQLLFRKIHHQSEA